METEVKLGFKDKESLYNVASSERFRGLCIKDPELSFPVLLENYYLDTKALTITKRGGAIRVRHFSGNDIDTYEFTVKYGGGTSKGVHRRFEWNVKSDKGNFSINKFVKDAADFGDPPELLDEVFKDIEDTDLYVICFNAFYRTVYELSYGDSKIEACFDNGRIRNADGSLTDEICELELELISGDTQDLDKLTAYLTEGLDCAPLNRTKYMRTLNLAMGDRNGG